MKSLREIVESSPQMRADAMHSLRNEESAQPLGPARWDWESVRRILIVRLRSVGDTVLTTPSLYALKRFLPQAQVDILLEDWVATVLEGFEYIDNVISMKRDSTVARARAIRQIRSANYDVVYNLHGGSTATLLTRASGAEHRVGYAQYQYGWLHNHLAPSSSLLWGRDKMHSVEQQLALLGWTGVPVTDRPTTHLAVTEQAAASVAARLRSKGLDEATRFALIHPAAAFDTKQWATEKFARVVEELDARALVTVAIAAPAEANVVAELKESSSAAVVGLTDLSLPEVTALAARARLFVGNDSGVAHIAAAVGTPAVVVFGSSSVTHWRPWTTAPAEVVLEEMPCQPCHGYFCAEFDAPECIRRIPVERVVAAVVRVLGDSI